jgi:hypothetical protein
LVDPASSHAIVGVDVGLIALIFAFRFAKEIPFITPADAYPVDEAETP